MSIKWVNILKELWLPLGLSTFIEYYYFPTPLMPFHWALLIPFYGSFRLISVHMFLDLFFFPCSVEKNLTGLDPLNSSLRSPQPHFHLKPVLWWPVLADFNQLLTGATQTAPHCGSLLAPASCHGPPAGNSQYNPAGISTLLRPSLANRGQKAMDQYLHLPFSP